VDGRVTDAAAAATPLLAALALPTGYVVGSIPVSTLFARRAAIDPAAAREGTLGSAGARPHRDPATGSGPASHGAVRAI